MLHPSGKYVKPIMHAKARLQRKTERDPGSAEGTPIYEEEQPTPPELTCPICAQLLREAVLTICCGESFCAECLQNRLLELGPFSKCPGSCCTSKISADSIVPNKKMRQAVDHFVSTHNAPSHAVVGTSKADFVDQMSVFQPMLQPQLIPQQQVWAWPLRYSYF